MGGPMWGRSLSGSRAGFRSLTVSTQGTPVTGWANSTTFPGAAVNCTASAGCSRWVRVSVRLVMWAGLRFVAQGKLHCRRSQPCSGSSP